MYSYIGSRVHRHLQTAKWLKSGKVGKMGKSGKKWQKVKVV
jgi:hypothetical protein